MTQLVAQNRAALDPCSGHSGIGFGLLATSILAGVGIVVGRASTVSSFRSMHRPLSRTPRTLLRSHGVRCPAFWAATVAYVAPCLGNREPERWTLGRIAAGRVTQPWAMLVRHEIANGLLVGLFLLVHTTVGAVIGTRI